MSKKSQKALASASILSLVMSTVVMAAPTAPTAGTPISGSSRVDTAIEIAKKAYANKDWKDSKVAVIANGDNSHLVDALAVAPLAAQKKAPIFLTLGTGTLETTVIDALKAQGVTTVYVAGGTVTADVDAQLKAAGVTAITHLAGANRWETSKKIGAELEKAGAPAAYAVVNTNDSVADALSIAAEAAKQNIEIVLATDKDNADVPAGKTVYAVGGSGVLSDALVSKLGAKRLGGNTRYATNAEVLKGLDASLDYTTTYVADGTNDHLVDSLPGSVLAAQTASPIVLVSDSVAPEVTEVVKGKAGKITSVVPLGGAVNAAAVQGIVNPNGTTPSNSDVKAGDIDTVKAIANNKVEVKFKDGVTPDSNAADYKVVEKGTTTALNVTDAAVEGQKIVLTTDAQKAGKAYTITVGAATVNFAGIAAVKEAPALDKVEMKDTNTVKVTFKKVVDSETATNVANYTLNNGATVKSAVLNDDRNAVTLTTDGVVKGKLYTITVKDVKNSDGVAMKSATKSFAGDTDTTAPKIKGNIYVRTNGRIEVSFDDKHGVDKTTAETLANYAIKDSSSNELKITSATAVKNDDTGYYDKVVLVTDTQTSNKKYTLTISNMIDGSVAQNKTSKDLTASFYGKAVDKSAPTVKTPFTIKSNTIIEVKFKDDSALDVATATNPDNYVFNNDLKVVKAEIKDTDKPYEDDGKTVVLTTTEMEHKNYTLSVSNVEDEFGNVMKTSKNYFMGIDAIKVAPSIKTVSSSDETTVKVAFDAFLDKASAEDPTNYVLDNDLGAVVKAEYDDDTKTVTLTTPSMTAGKAYKVTINGVKDITGNETNNLVGKFVASRTSADTTTPSIDSVQAVSQTELRVTFDEPVKAAGTIGLSYYEYANNATVGSIHNAQEVGFTDDDKTVIFKLPSTGMLDGSKDYVITTLANVADKSNNLYTYASALADQTTFAGTNAYNELPSYDSFEQTDVKTVKVHFSETIVAPSLTLPAYSGYSFKVDDDDDTILDITKSSAWTVDDKGVDFNFSNIVTDLIGGNAIDENDEVDNNGNITTPNGKTNIKPYIEDTDKPELLNAEATNINKVKLTFSETIDTLYPGAYRITYKDSNDKTQNLSVSPASVDSDDKTIVYVPTSNMDSDTEYTITPIASAKDVAGNTLDMKDVSLSFMGSEVKVIGDYITGVAVVDAETIKVSNYNANLTGTTNITVTELDSKGNNTSNVILATPSANKDGVTTYILATPLLADTNYKVTVVGMSGSSYTVPGIAEDANIAVTFNSATSSAAITFADSNDTTNKTVELYSVNPTTGLLTSLAAPSAVPGGFGAHYASGLAVGDTVLVVVKINGTATYAAKVVVAAQ